MSRNRIECSKSDLDRPPKKRVSTIVPSKHEEPTRQIECGSDFLAVINKNRACSCEVIARAVRADLPKYLGMTERRDILNDDLAIDLDQPTGEEPENPDIPKITSDDHSESDK